jgi:hypothetical protein
MTYYTVYVPKNGKPYLEECEEYVSFPREGIICNRNDVYHEDYRLQTIVYCNFEESLSCDPKQFDSNICADSSMYRDKFEGLDYESATFILNQLLDKNNY